MSTMVFCTCGTKWSRLLGSAIATNFSAQATGRLVEPNCKCKPFYDQHVSKSNALDNDASIDPQNIVSSAIGILETFRSELPRRNVSYVLSLVSSTYRLVN